MRAVRLPVDFRVNLFAQAVEHAGRLECTTHLVLGRMRIDAHRQSEHKGAAGSTFGRPARTDA